MSFFKKTFGVIASLGFVTLLMVISFVVSILFFKENTSSSNKEEVEIYLKEEVKNFLYRIDKNNLNITVEFKEEKNNAYYVSYAYYYYDEYDYKVNMTVESENKYIFVTVIDSENSNIFIHTI